MLAFLMADTNVRTARLLLMMAVPGHVIYLMSIRLIKGNQVALTTPFVASYLLVAIVQVSILLYFAHVLVPFLWTKSIDPDNSAIPGLSLSSTNVTTNHSVIVNRHYGHRRPDWNGSTHRCVPASGHSARPERHQQTQT